MATKSGRSATTSGTKSKAKSTVIEVNLKGVVAGRRKRRHIPEGFYRAKVTDVEANHKFKTGTRGVVWQYEVIDKGPGLGAGFYNNNVFINEDGTINADALWTIRGALEALTPKIKIPEKLIRVDLSKYIGRTVALEIGDDEYEGKIVSTILDVFNEDMLEEEEEEDSEDLDDDDEEEDEEEEEDDEEEEEDEEEDEDEVDLEDDEL